MYDCSKSEGWQYAPMYMIFDIKQQHLRHKAILVCGGHAIDSTGHITYSSIIKDILVQLFMIIVTQNNLDMMVGDIENAFSTAPCAEKIWGKAGPEFGNKAGSTIILKRALYGIKTVSRSFHELFGDWFRSIGFPPSRVDQDLCNSENQTTPMVTITLLLMSTILSSLQKDHQNI
jgi:hypothetical protein